MNPDQISKLVKFADSLVYEKTEQHLEKVEKDILRQTLSGKKLCAIKCPSYEDSYVQRFRAPKLWERLSIVAREKVRKKTVLEVLQRLQLQQSQFIQSDVTEAEEPIFDQVEGCYPESSHNRRKDWGEAMCGSNFYGRTEELAILRQWLLVDRCRLVTILGMGGVGKSCLSVRLAKQIQDRFERIIWRSLRDAPPIKEILANLIQFLSKEQETEADLPESTKERISRLIYYLGSLRCLIVLDNAESLFDSGSQRGKYRQGYEGYGELFKRVGESNLTSCLILTAREKPKEVANLEGEGLSVRSLPLKGFKEGEGLEIFRVKGLSGSESELKALSDRYAGNPLALKVVATTILDLFGGNISEFLRQEQAVFGDIRNVLDQQFERLSNLEKKIMYWLAIAREPISLSELREDFALQVPPLKILEALESLSRRSLIEKKASRFTQQPVVMEYVTSNLIEKVCDEIVSGQFSLFRDHALIKATAKDYVRETQICLILQPVIDGLLAVFRSKKDIEARLTQIIATLQKTSPLERGYTAGNIINLFCQMETDLKGSDFSSLTIWQADLRNVCLHNVSFQNANLAKSVFNETFGGVASVTFDPDGKILAAGDTNGEIRLQQVADGKQLFSFKGHTNWVTSLAFSPNGSILASGSIDCIVKLWNVSTGECLYTLQEHEHEVWSVTFSPDGNILASGSDDCTARLWRVSTGECLKVFQGHTDYVLSVAFSLDGQLLVSGSHDRTIRLWDLKTDECLKIFRGHDDGIRAIAISPDGQTIASSSNDRTVRLWDLKTGECKRIFRGHDDGVWSVAFSPQGNMLASSSIDRTVRLWDLKTGECKRIFSEHNNWVLSVAFDPQGNTLVSGSRDQTKKLWDIRTGKCFKTFQGHINQILSVAFSSDGQMLASGGNDQKIRLWNIHNGQVLKTFQGHTNWVYSVAYSLQSNNLISGSGDKTVKLWDASTGQAIRTLEGHQAAVRSVTSNPKLPMLASGSEDRTVKLWDASTGQAIRTLEGHQAAIWSVAFSFDGSILASGAIDGTIKLWSISTGKCLRTLEGHESWVWSVAFSPNNHTLASTSPDRTLRLWDISTGECLRIMQSKVGWLLSIAFSFDSQTLASSCQDNSIKLWNVNTGECLRTLEGHTAVVWSVAFSPNNQTLVSSSEDESIKLWNVKNGECLKVLTVKKPYECMNIREIKGVTEATINTLKIFGAKS